jgi:hypothetical protein
LRKINAGALELFARRAQDLAGIFRQPQRQRLDGEVCQCATRDWRPASARPSL